VSGCRVVAEVDHREFVSFPAVPDVGDDVRQPLVVGQGGGEGILYPTSPMIMMLTEEATTAPSESRFRMSGSSCRSRRRARSRYSPRERQGPPAAYRAAQLSKPDARVACGIHRPARSTVTSRPPGRACAWHEIRARQ